MDIENEQQQQQQSYDAEELIIGFLALHEEEIKRIFPSTVTHTSNLDFSLIHKSLEKIGFSIKTTNDLVRILAFLHDEGFFSYVNDYQIVVNNGPIYSMEWKA